MSARNRVYPSQDSWPQAGVVATWEATAHDALPVCPTSVSGELQKYPMCPPNTHDEDHHAGFATWEACAGVNPSVFVHESRQYCLSEAT